MIQIHDTDGSGGKLSEWKIDMDSPNDTHRHLSHLVGLYPGYALASYNSSIQAPPHGQAYTKAEVLNATQISLIHRGNGTGPDADSGWEKVWRAAAWAQFADSDTFYEELSVSDIALDLSSSVLTSPGVVRRGAKLCAKSVQHVRPVRRGPHLPD